MNGAVFYCWYQIHQDVARDRHPGEFSDADIAARQAAKSRSLMSRIAARLIGLAHRHAVMPTAPAPSI